MKYLNYCYIRKVYDMICFILGLFGCVLAGACGAFMNRVRGGFIENFPMRRTMNALIFGMSVVAFTQSWWGLLGVLGMFVGQSLGWGRYIGALGGWEKYKLEEVKFIDFLIKPLAPLSYTRS